MREQAGLLEHQTAHRAQIFDGGGVSLLLEPLAVLRIAKLGFVTQTEKGFLAAGSSPGSRHRQHLVRGHGVSLPIARFARERAIAAAVSTELREGNEDLAGIRDYAASP